MTVSPLVAPVSPWAPVSPVSPVVPFSPVEPVEPIDPVRPVDPASPFDPVAPVGPAGPATGTVTTVGVTTGCLSQALSVSASITDIAENKIVCFMVIPLLLSDSYRAGGAGLQPSGFTGSKYVRRALQSVRQLAQRRFSQSCLHESRGRAPAHRCKLVRGVGLISIQNQLTGVHMNINLSLAPLVSLIAGILILIMPRLLNYIVAFYLIIIGLIGLFGAGNFNLR